MDNQVIPDLFDEPIDFENQVIRQNQNGEVIDIQEENEIDLEQDQLLQKYKEKVDNIYIIFEIGQYEKDEFVLLGWIPHKLFIGNKINGGIFRSNLVNKNEKIENFDKKKKLLETLFFYEIELRQEEQTIEKQNDDAVKEVREDDEDSKNHNTLSKKDQTDEKSIGGKKSERVKQAKSPSNTQELKKPNEYLDLQVAKVDKYGILLDNKSKNTKQTNAKGEIVDLPQPEQIIAFQLQSEKQKQENIKKQQEEKRKQQEQQKHEILQQQQQEQLKKQQQKLEDIQKQLQLQQQIILQQLLLQQEKEQKKKEEEQKKKQEQEQQIKQQQQQVLQQQQQQEQEQKKKQAQEQPPPQPPGICLNLINLTNLQNNGRVNYCVKMFFSNKVINDLSDQPLDFEYELLNQNKKGDLIKVTESNDLDLNQKFLQNKYKNQTDLLYLLITISQYENAKDNKLLGWHMHKVFKNANELNLGDFEVKLIDPQIKINYNIPEQQIKRINSSLKYQFVLSNTEQTNQEKNDEQAETLQKEQPQKEEQENSVQLDDFFTVNLIQFLNIDLKEDLAYKAYLVHLTEIVKDVNDENIFLEGVVEHKKIKKNVLDMFESIEICIPYEKLVKRYEKSLNDLYFVIILESLDKKKPVRWGWYAHQIFQNGNLNEGKFSVNLYSPKKFYTLPMRYQNFELINTSLYYSFFRVTKDLLNQQKDKKEFINQLYKSKNEKELDLEKQCIQIDVNQLKNYTQKNPFKYRISFIHENKIINGRDGEQIDIDGQFQDGDPYNNICDIYEECMVNVNDVYLKNKFKDYLPKLYMLIKIKAQEKVLEKLIGWGVYPLFDDNEIQLGLQEIPLFSPDQEILYPFNFKKLQKTKMSITFTLKQVIPGQEDESNELYNI